MRKLTQITLGLAAAALLGQAAHADQLADIKQKGTLVCGTLGTAEPFSFPNPQTRETQGYDVDFCAALAKALGVKLELKLISVPARISELQQGRVDVLAANLGWTAERAQQMRLSPFRWLYWPSTALIYVMRGLPLIMLVFWVYFFLPVLLGSPVGGFGTLLATLVIYEAAYLAEIVRAGIQSLPAGQMEAARSLGLSHMRAMRKVVLPQALYNMVPAMLGQFVSTIKETSLGYVISVNELTFAANQVNSALLTKPFPVFVVLAVIYFVLCFSLTQVARQLEKRVARQRAGSKGAAALAAFPEMAAIAE